VTIRGITGPVPKLATDIAKKARACIKQAADEMESDLKKVLATSEWAHVERVDTPAGITVRMAGKTAEWMVRGTKPKTLPYKTDGFYVFPTWRKRKTKPRQFVSFPESVSSEKVFTKGPIRQKGIEPGQWPGISAARIRPKLNRKLRSIY